METTIYSALPVLLLFASSTFADSSKAASELKISADTPVVAVKTRAEGRNFMRLPSLPYEFALEIACEAGLNPTTLSISVADTRRSLQAEALLDTQKALIAFTVPAAQIGPVALNEFCLQTSDSPELLMLPSVLSVQASLLCANDMERHMIYASAPLAVALQCTAPPLELRSE